MKTNAESLLEAISSGNIIFHVFHSRCLKIGSVLRAHKALGRQKGLDLMYSNPQKIERCGFSQFGDFHQWGYPKNAGWLISWEIRF